MSNPLAPYIGLAGDLASSSPSAALMLRFGITRGHFIQHVTVTTFTFSPVNSWDPCELEGGGDEGVCAETWPPSSW